MKLIIIFLSLCLPLFAIKGGFDEGYYRLNTEEKAKVFSQKLDKLLDVSFEKILKERSFVEAFFKKHAPNGFRKLDEKEIEKIIELKNKYRVNNLFDFKDYLRRIDIVPKSMGIAQAMLESGMGTSRFAREANNLFGEWTWSEKGLVPKKRAKGKSHRIRIFDDLQESVDSYLLNLNRHDAYKGFRNLRQQYRQNDEKLTGLKAIKTLHNYSEIKGEYEKRLKNLILKYELDRFD
ncbi:mannosyl-glycoprotein endo-beta-N-acetylglucosamidase [Campylobacter sp. MIT 99-7217]|uniref:glucosaminidase domain-containing protein n=1 Tax=Campylobacter sp. MIT 99-7217 TaxID=535091 RepID=UPI001158D0BB|nr:glucosaminidase domain-containing protein [Campylobacter sp. MIT 99-7217]TQR32453.1 mannosyl-glycoprotein endo-beta-N-acetylglucosamidase [Campylobacter sp. MIT 99-7217]